MSWWNTYPRKIAYPYKIVAKDAVDMRNKFNNMNGMVNKLYVGLYKCDLDGGMEEVTLDIVSFDIDWDDKYNTMVELHNHLMEKNWKHQVMFSTNGFWIYVFCKPKTYKKILAKKKLAAMQAHIIEKTSLKFGDAKSCPLDRAIFGDVERITRFPGSLDKKRNKFAIFLSQEDIDKGMDHIVNIDTFRDIDRRMKIYYHGDLIALDPDQVKMLDNYQVVQTKEFTISEYNFSIPEDISEIHKKILGMMPKAVKSWVCDKDQATWKARAYATLWMREKGFTQKQTESFLKPFYEKMPRTDEWKNNWNHYKNSAQVSDHIYRRHDLWFPNIKTLMNEGLVSNDSSEKGKSFIYK